MQLEAHPEVCEGLEGSPGGQEGVGMSSRRDSADREVFPEGQGCQVSSGGPAGGSGKARSPT